MSVKGVPDFVNLIVDQLAVRIASEMEQRLRGIIKTLQQSPQRVAQGRREMVGRREMAAILGVSESTLDRAVREGVLQPVRIGRRPMFDPVATIEAFSKHGGAR